VTATEVELLLRLLDEITAHVDALSQREETFRAEPGRASVAAEEVSRTVRTDVSDVDVVIGTLSEIGVHAGRLRAPLEELASARKMSELLASHIGAPRTRDVRPGGELAAKVMRTAEELRTTLAHLERRFAAAIEGMDRELRQAQTAAERLRLIPASTLFPALERTAHDVARSLGRTIEFHGRGGDVRLDTDVLATLQPALIQLVRNAVAHGIEAPAERQIDGKPATGHVIVEVIPQAKRVTFRCRDDGRGIDLAAVRRAAGRKGLLDGRIESLSTDATLQLLFAGGVTTSSTVTQTSGRGVGLDVVRETVSQLGGEVAARTEMRRGTAVDLIVPISLTSVEALLVETAGVTAAIPVNAVRLAMRVDPRDVAQTASGPALVHEGTLRPFVSLSRLLGLHDSDRTNDAVSAILIGSGNEMSALAVRRIVRTEDVVMRPLPPTAPAASIVIGAAFDSHGTPQLMLDPDELLIAVRRRELGTDSAGALSQRPPVLVIDDSLTTRMLEQSILESAGYEVQAAASAEEAMEMARRNDYALFLVDVEMPGMDGFTFVEQTRADPVLRKVPAILVTSRNAPEDRQRGKNVGASAYIVKSEFDQTHLLQIIGELVA
jgi:two-component system chemotaxis sensor kinase CheA